MSNSLDSPDSPLVYGMTTGGVARTTLPNPELHMRRRPRMAKKMKKAEKKPMKKAK
jgi:hypothetical protein